MHKDAILLIQEGIYALDDCNYSRAEELFFLALKLTGDNFEILYKLALIYAKKDRYEDAKIYFLKALSLSPSHPIICHNLGLIYSIQNNNLDALKYYDLAISNGEEGFESLINKSSVLNQLGRHEEAAETAKLALVINSSIPEAWSNLGIAYRHLKRLEESLKAYDHALNINPNLIDVIYNKALALNSLEKFDEAIFYLKQVIRANPNHAESWLHLAIAQEKIHLIDDALLSYEKGLEINPNFPEAWSNRGNLLGTLSRFNDAIKSYDFAINHWPENCMLWVNKAHTLFEMNQIKYALNCYIKAFEIDPNYDYLIGNLANCYISLCDWGNFDPLVNKIFAGIKSQSKSANPFFTLAITDSINLQKKSAEIFSSESNMNEEFLQVPINRSRNKKIRIGYLSSNFNTHAVGILTAELFELHDRSIFEVYGFSSTLDKKDFMSERIKGSFDHFIDVNNINDEDLAKKLRSLQIDIAIDLGGFTKNSRSIALSYRAAPIQINFLGFPGTMGVKYIDYIIGDQIVIPEASKNKYSEKIIYLPNSFQANDSKRRISTNTPSREDFFLPESAFIFCCFNNPYKITPLIFKSWLKILSKCPNSILWLLEDVPGISSNLRSEAEKALINPNRLIFSGRLPPDQYLARYKLADLFLDTYPFNAGTTASDALWAGLPILTLSGEAFASRMAASILSAVNLPELITNSQEDYINKAIYLSLNPDKLLYLKNKLKTNRSSAPLFNSRLFTKHLENGFLQAFDRYSKNLDPADIWVSP